jgi:phosphatidate cytidylyltransferase
MLATRIVSALVLGLVLAGVLFGLDTRGWANAMLVVMGACAWEWGGLARFGLAARLLGVLVVVLACAGIAPWALPDHTPAASSALGWVLAAGALFWCVCVPLWLWRLPAQVSDRWIALMALPGLLPAYVASVALRELGAGWLLVIMAIVWVADTSAYGFGRWLGRHKLAPRVSPGKTWEGVAGALGVLACLAIVLALLAPDSPLAVAGQPALVLGMLALGVASVMGDLFESSLKRHAGVKDSGHLIPGHGGVLDRLDAQFPVLPLAAGLLYLAGVIR